MRTLKDFQQSTLIMGILGRRKDLCGIKDYKSLTCSSSHSQSFAACSRSVSLCALPTRAHGIMYCEKMSPVRRRVKRVPQAYLAAELQRFGCGARVQLR
jgi:hypothetical protein